MVFDIKNISCSYSKNGPIILNIKELVLKKGNLNFIIGKSGIGKSTFLETIGMMSNTIRNTKSNPESHFYFAGNSNSKLNLLDFWGKDERFISNLRRKFFSFLFQNTNLMDSMTVFENIMLPQLMSGIDWKTAEKNTHNILNELNLIGFNENTRINNISGGQKQRVAFCRALAKPFTVLFGDEPTGNLDEMNAKNLIKVLKNNINENNTAIIVSHDLDLALNFADKIIMIKTQNNNNLSYGLIDSTSSFTFQNNLWSNNQFEFNNSEMREYLYVELNK
jgi:ABC-type lipoprotein export system ATPase subunit